MKHVIGEIHPNGKWMWTEYKKGKFDWRGLKTASAEVPATPKADNIDTPKSGAKETATISGAAKPRTKKAFIEETAYDLTEEECKEYFFGWGKILDTFVRSSWNYSMGRIGSCTLTIESSKTGKKKDFDKHPDWRPLGFYRFSVRGWNGEYIEIEGFIQSWAEIRKISDTESFTIQLVKHPHQ